MSGSSQKMILVVSCLGLLSASYLVYSELRSPGVCPAFLGVPACYLVFTAFGFILFSPIASTRARGLALFVPGAVIGLGLALWFSVHQILDLAQCPKAAGIPLCYASLATFSLLIALRIAGSSSRRPPRAIADTES